MPSETKKAVEWALEQKYGLENGNFETIKNKNGEVINRHMFVDFVRQYFNDNNISYTSFSFYDLEPFL